jgi:hypothetical protein
MSDRENDRLDEAEAVDPPENQPGGGGAMSMDSTDDSNSAVDPPENQPGGGQQ